MTRTIEHVHRHVIDISPGTRLFLAELVRQVVRAHHG